MVKLCDDAASEIQSMVRSNDSRVFRFLRLYMMMRPGDNNIYQVLDAKDLLTKPVVFTAWETGRVDILQNCIRWGIPIGACNSVASAIRSGRPETLDFCVKHGGSVIPTARPYCHCTTTGMMEHIWTTYRCKLYDRDAVFPRDLDITMKYMEMGGTVVQMGKELNDECHREGNWQRSLPIKRAYMEHNEPYESALARSLMSLPKSLVNLVCDFM
jgi:hypothetical protein